VEPFKPCYTIRYVYGAVDEYISIADQSVEL
jgi:hypothetical protein